MAKTTLDLEFDTVQELIKLIGEDRVDFIGGPTELHRVIGKLTRDIVDISESKSLKQILRSVLSD